MDGNKADLERRIKNTDPDSCPRITHAAAFAEKHLRERTWSSEERDFRRKSGGRAFLAIEPRSGPSGKRLPWPTRRDKIIRSRFPFSTQFHGYSRDCPEGESFHRHRVSSNQPCSHGRSSTSQESVESRRRVGLLPQHPGSRFSAWAKPHLRTDCLRNHESILSGNCSDIRGSGGQEQLRDSVDVYRA